MCVNHQRNRDAPRIWRITIHLQKDRTQSKRSVGFRLTYDEDLSHLWLILFSMEPITNHHQKRLDSRLRGNDEVENSSLNAANVCVSHWLIFWIG